MNGEIGEVQSVAVNSPERLKGKVQSNACRGLAQIAREPNLFTVGPLKRILEIGSEHSEIQL